MIFTLLLICITFIILIGHCTCLAIQRTKVTAKHFDFTERVVRSSMKRSKSTRGPPDDEEVSDIVSHGEGQIYVGAE